MKKGRALLKYVLHAAVLGGVIWAGYKTIDPKQFDQALDDFNWWLTPLVCLLGFGSVCIKAWRFASVLNEVNEIKRSVAMKAYIAGQSMTLLPGGIAARAGLLKQVGVKVEDSSPAVAMSSITDQIAFILCGLLSALWFEEARRPVMILLAILALVAIILGIEATRTWLLSLVERLLGRFNLLERWRAFTEQMSETVSWRTMLVGIGNALMSFALLVLGLYLCMRGVGHSVPFLVLLLAYTVPTMVGRISAMPGGIGLTEVGMVGVLDHVSGVKLGDAAAAVLVFRLSTVLFTAIVGAILYWTEWRRVAKSETAVAS